jgi:hypothetical protein
MNHYGMPVDNVLSLNLVTAAGELLTLTQKSPSYLTTTSNIDGEQDLLWAVLGAGPNFGIVTSATLNAFPLIDNGDLWVGELLFPLSSLAQFISALNTLDLSPNMTLLWGYSYRGPEVGFVITAQVSYMSSSAEIGRQAFRLLYDLEPISDSTTVVAYDHINDDTVALCEKGGRKPGWFTGLRGEYDYPTWETIMNEFVAFVNDTGLDGTTILVECYDNDALRAIGNKYSSYAHRAIDYYAWILFSYEDTVLDSTVEQFGSRVRDLWRSTSGFANETHQRT